MQSKDNHPSAVVVGCCAHGLALIRDLARSGVAVHVVDADPDLPGWSTRYGRKHRVADINGSGLIDSLLRLRGSIAPGERPVLFLTNDRMVREVAARVSEIAVAYRLSWHQGAARVAELTSKTWIEAQCRAAGLNYPTTVVADTLEALQSAAADLKWPQIIKPSRPLSSFKVKVAASLSETADFLRSRGADFPVLLQQWIPGDDMAIRFSALYLDNGEPIARFDGRKLRSYPMGHTTVAEPSASDLTFDYARRFFAGTGISGPASLEVKLDPQGNPWIIEPTVGRTDFWIDLCIANGVRLPTIEYRHQCGTRDIAAHALDQAIWINAERDPRALFWLATHIGLASKAALRIRFTYLDRHDLRPFFRAMRVLAHEVLHALRKRVRTAFRAMRPA
jgi:predicted ATP-grasp superfamily ATP-dependent carboligase